MWSNFKVEWNSWWRELSWVARLAPLIAVAFHLAYTGFRGGPSFEDCGLASLFLVAFYALPAKRALFSFVAPLYVGWLVHQALTALPPDTFWRFTGKESSEIDRRFLSFLWEEKEVTVPQFLNLWIHGAWLNWAGKLLLGVPWLVLGFSALVRFYYNSRGSSRYSAWGVDTLSPQMNWTIVAVWVVGVFGFPSQPVAMVTVATYYAFKFGILRVPVLVGGVVVSFIAMASGQAYSVDVIFGIVQALLFSSVSDMLAYQKPKRTAQKVWNPSIHKKDPPTPKKKAG